MERDTRQPATELVRRAAELVPLLREHAQWAEHNRRLHEEVVSGIADAGLLRLRVPQRYGGYECGAHTLVEVAGELGRGDGSAAWVTSVHWITSWMVGLFPDEAQDDVFGGSPDVQVCGTLSPGGTAAPTDDGVVVDGRWGFISGAQHSQWQVIIAVTPLPDGTPMPVLALVPLRELEIIDDWHTSGLRGTGSVTTAARGVVVPRHRVVPLPAALQEQYASAANADSAVFRAPLVPTAAASSVGSVIGMARGAREAFLDRLDGRKITYTTYESQREAPLTHLQVADATIRLDEAEFHSRRLADLVDAKGASGEPWKLDERARARADMGRACQLGKEAVDILNTASGGSSIYSSVPIQRFERDVQAVNLHALMHPNTNLELYGRVLCGLDPNTLYI